MGMNSATLRAVIVVTALAATAATSLWCAAGLADLRGVPAAALQLASQPLRAAILTAVAIGVALSAAVLVGRYLNAVVGMFVLGCGIGVLAMRTGAIDGAAFDGASAVGLSIETLVWAPMVLVFALVVFRLSGRLPDEPPDLHERTHRSWLLDPSAGRVLACALAAPLAVWLVAVNDWKGQSIGAMVVGGLVAGLISRLAAPDARPVVAYGAAVLTVGAAQLVLAPAGDLAAILATGQISPITRVMPLDAAAGACAGVSLGIGWARSFMKARPHEAGYAAHS